MSASVCVCFSSGRWLWDDHVGDFSDVLGDSGDDPKSAGVDK